MFPKWPVREQIETRRKASFSTVSSVRFEPLVRLIPVLQAEQDASPAWRLARIDSTSQPTHTGCSNSEPWKQGWGSNSIHCCSDGCGSLDH